MIVILGYDGLEYDYVTEFGLKGLMQTSYGTTDISEFEQPRTMVIWSSFLTGRNLEKKILSLGKNFWNFRLKPEETFFAKFKKWKAIDVPGFAYKKEMHDKEKEIMKLVLEDQATIEEYDKVAFENHKENKEEFFGALNEDYEILMGYFALADVIGHMSFGIKPKMKLIYKELEEIANETKKHLDEKDILLIISDHGMIPIGRYGDHSDHGFWSFNKEIKIGKPKVTEFRSIIEGFENFK